MMTKKMTPKYSPEVRERAVRMRESDIVARLGGDEFVVVLTEVGDSAVAEHVAEKILLALRQDCRLGGHVLHSTPGIGMAFFPSDGEDGAALMKSADIAMYHAKSRGRNNIQRFGPEMRRAGIKLPASRPAESQ